MFKAWLTSWLIGIAAVAGAIAVAWSIATYRELKRAGAPGAGRILTRLWLSPVARFLRLGRVETTPGGLAWVWWDLRWGPSGQTTATIRGTDGTALHLSLAKPIGLYLATGELLQVTDVRFKPSDDRGYAWRTVAGVLEPVNSEAWERTAGERPHARLCVL
jgi:hypothetical protein